MTARPIMQQAVRFAVAGGVATLVHYAILYALVEGAHAAPLLGSSIGFIVGVVVSFFLNRRFTFTQQTPLLASFAKYALVYAVGFVLNGFILQTLIAFGWYYFAAQAGATLIVLCWNFLGARFVAFR
ncbi:MAG TPA: GtrA family protein [Vitreimonas sp.]|nr:GtrA family protein [Vitreimonas sp.]